MTSAEPDGFDDLLPFMKEAVASLAGSEQGLNKESIYG